MGVRKEWKLRRKRSRMLPAFLLPEALLFFVVDWNLVCTGSMNGKRSSKIAVSGAAAVWSRSWRIKRSETQRQQRTA